MSDEIRPASDEQRRALVLLHEENTQQHATIAALTERISWHEAEVERYGHLNSLKCVERGMALSAELATARAQIAALRAILSDAVELGWDRSSAIRRMTAALASATRADAEARR